MASHEGGARRVPRVWLVVAVVVAVMLAGVATVLSWPDSPSPVNSNASPARSSATIPASASAAPTSAAPTSAAPAASTSAAGQPPAAPRPVISSLTGTANGLTVTMKLTFAAQADRGPFTCHLRWSQILEFGCSPGTVTQTYDNAYTGGFELFGVVTDRFGAPSDQFDSWVDVPAIAPPTYSNLQITAEHSSDPAATGILMEFDVQHAPGDHPHCDISIGTKTFTINPCEGHVSHFEQVEATGTPVPVTLGVYSRAPLPPAPPDMLGYVTV